MQMPVPLCARGIPRIDERPLRTYSQATFDRRKAEARWAQSMVKRAAREAAKLLDAA